VHIKTSIFADMGKVVLKEFLDPMRSRSGKGQVCVVIYHTFQLACIYKKTGDKHDQPILDFKSA